MMQRYLPAVWCRTAALFALALAATCASAADRAGSVQLVLGDAKIVMPDGNSRTVTRGDAVEVGQTLQTGASGHIHLQMVDGAFVSVRPKSRLRIEEYRYDTAQPSNNRIKFVLEEGVARSITGKAGEAAKENFRMNTPLAAIGIRGTDFVAQAAPGVTRVTVQSGAISMSPLSDDCLASALGPCQSASTRVLTAAMRNAYLELRSRNEAPLLVPAEKALESPNLIAPPAKEEPRVSMDKTSKQAATTDAARDAVRDVAADTLKAKVGTSNTGSTSISTAPPATLVPTTPPIEVVVQAPTQFWWGRWSNYIGAGEEGREFVKATDPANPNRVSAGSNNVFGLVRDGGDVVMPSSGVAKFSLADSEAYFMSNGKTLTSASVTSPSLTVDFNARRYDTSLTLTNSADRSSYVMTSTGDVTFQGALVNDLGSTQLNGSLSKDTKQAGYVFQRDISGNTTVVGATRWTR